MKNKKYVKLKFETGDLVQYDIFGIGRVLYRDNDGLYKVSFKYGDKIHKQWCREKDLKLYKKRYELNKNGNELYLRLTELSLKYNTTFEDVVKRYIMIEGIIRKKKQERKSFENGKRN